MKKNSSALIILERPWGYGDRDQNVVSVLPYFQGLEKLNGNFDLFHSNFYDANSFKMALDELTKQDYKKYYIYLATHGSGRRLNNINLSTALEHLNIKAQTRNIVGVVIGACLVGNNTEDLELYTESSSIVWKIAYKCSVGWLDGTLLDIKLFNELMSIKSNHLFDKKHVINAMKRALRVYKPDEHIGWNKDDEEMALSDSLAAIIQPKGQGNKAKDYSHLLFDET